MAQLMTDDELASNQLLGESFAASPPEKGIKNGISVVIEIPTEPRPFGKPPTDTLNLHGDQRDAINSEVLNKLSLKRGSMLPAPDSGEVLGKRGYLGQADDSQTPSKRGRPKKDIQNGRQSPIEPSVPANKSPQKLPRPSRLKNGPKNARSNDIEFKRPLELFGQDSALKEIVSRAKSIGVSIRSGKESKNLPPLATTTVEEIVAVINRVRRIYKFHLTQDPSDNEKSLLNSNQVQELLEEIRDSVDNLEEEQMGNKKSEVIQDIRAHAIRKLSFLLKSALEVRATQLSQPNDINSLKETIFIMDIIDCLCQTSQQWDAKPNINAPITRPIPSIHSSVKVLQKTFTQKLHDRQTKARRRENLLRSSQIKDQKEEGLQREALEKERKRELRKKLIHKEASRNVACLFGRIRTPNVRSIVDNEPSSVTTKERPPPPPPQWTEEQDKELLIQIHNPESRNLYSEERYLAILNAPLLQNKLPEHIRERAIYYKPAMVRHYESMGAGKVPEWVEVIE